MLKFRKIYQGTSLLQLSVLEEQGMRHANQTLLSEGMWTVLSCHLQRTRSREHPI